jgi:hypothetical protein
VEQHKGNAGKRNNVEAIYKKLKDNHFKCALSGIDLAPDDFCLDHIQPFADGGTNHVSNLQCVHPLINKMKGTMSSQQFIELCKAVARHNP